MLLDIIQPDAGEVSVFGAALTAGAQERIGYLPEERGLYRSLRVIPNLLYLAELKGVPRERAMRRADELLDRLGLEPHRGKKVSELSRGLGQLVQFAATLIHEPAFVVLDEPFSGLDPVNVRLMKDAVAELRATGAAIMFSTHQMTDVEELCDRVVMIDEGQVVLDGLLTEIKRQFAGSELFVVSDQSPDSIDGVLRSRRDGTGYVLRLVDGYAPEDVLRALLDRGAKIDRFELATPSLEEIFLRVVEGRHA
jgi:ABC-2 type transport system ATP-binding protein